MLDWKEIVQDYIIRHSNKIKKVTAPLRDRFGVSYFTYHRIDTEGKYTVLLDRPDWAEHYVSKKFYIMDPYLRHPDVYQSGACIVGAHGSCEYKEEILKSGKKYFDQDIGILLIERTQSGVEFFGFAGNQASGNFHKLYLNHLSLMQTFAVHFKTELQSLLLQMQEEASTLSFLKGADFHCKAPIIPTLALDERLDFINALGMQQYVRQAKRLTKRERECLRLLVQGKSAKETAASLCLSRRTVESYFDNIKAKLGCLSKAEVFTMAKNFEKLNILLP